MLPAYGQPEDNLHPEADGLNKKGVLLVYVLLSSSAAALLLLLAWEGSMQPSRPSFSDKAIVCMVFMASCLLGIVLSARPRFFGGKKKGRPTEPPEGADRPRYVAHHPDCGSFQERIVSMRGISYCGGCLGLMVGSAVALALSLLYLLGLDLDVREGLIATVLGMVIVAFCLAGIGSRRGSNHSHLLANALLVIGFFLVTMGTLSVTGSAAYGLVAVIPCFLWLDARIQISDWRHARTCRACGRGCGFY
jgi:hypothetical protein